jgi:lipoprotein-anchoring transpeptidase ErfK/SrfK
VQKGALAIGAGLLAACAVVGFAAAFALSASAAGADTGTTSTTVTTTETTTTTAPPPPTVPPPAPKRNLIAPGVSIGSILVGWLTAREATELVRKTYEKPLVLIVSHTEQIRLAPEDLGARVKVAKAVHRAQVARPGAAVPLDVDVSRQFLRHYLKRLGHRLDRKAVDAGVVLKGLNPRVVKAAKGRRLKVLRNALMIRVALATQVRDPLQIEFDVLKPKVLKVKVRRTAIVILRDTKKLRYYLDQKLFRTFSVATGQSTYPTPTGAFEIATLQRNPWWYPPPSPWAADEDPVPPGPGNPLGTRWMGLSEPYVGIHGTPDAASIGYSASHGCIRMLIPDAEWLFQRVKVGTPVFIVSR